MLSKVEKHSHMSYRIKPEFSSTTLHGFKFTKIQKRINIRGDHISKDQTCKDATSIACPTFTLGPKRRPPTNFDGKINGRD